jgi:hypothetical protein
MRFIPRRWSAAFVLVLLSAWPTAAHQRRPVSPLVLEPVDEAARRSDFFTFRAHLQVTVARRDWQRLLMAVHPSIRNSFGPDEGLATFRTQWREGAPESPLWTELAAVLALGGSFDREGHFVAPYVFSRWPEHVEPFEHVAIVGSQVRVRAAPQLSADTLMAVSYAILPRAPSGSGRLATTDEGWVAVSLPRGGVGFVAGDYTRSPVDYRAIFRLSSAGWQMVAFIAGD